MLVPLPRFALVVALGLVPATAAWWFTGEALAGWAAWSGPARGVDTAVVAAAATAGALVAGWLALGTLVSGGCVLAGSVHRPAIVPAALHRSVALVLGVALAAGTAPPPGAAHGPVPAPVSATAAHGAPDPAWTPTGPGATAAPVRAGAAEAPAVAPDPGWRPAAAPVAAPRTVSEPIDPILLTGSRQAPGAEPLTVRRGDTLWDLAARHLGAGATDAEIAAEWPRWYAANRDTLGTDPDLLLPGQQLVPPGRVNGG